MDRNSRMNTLELFLKKPQAQYNPFAARLFLDFFTFFTTLVAVGANRSFFRTLAPFRPTKNGPKSWNLFFGTRGGTTIWSRDRNTSWGTRGPLQR